MPREASKSVSPSTRPPAAFSGTLGLRLPKDLHHTHLCPRASREMAWRDRAASALSLLTQHKYYTTRWEDSSPTVEDGGRNVAERPRTNGPLAIPVIFSFRKTCANFSAIRRLVPPQTSARIDRKDLRALPLSKRKKYQIIGSRAMLRNSYLPWTPRHPNIIGSRPLSSFDDKLAATAATSGFMSQLRA